MSNLVAFLTNLAVDPHQQMALANTPDIVMQSSGLNQTEQMLIKSANSANVSQVFENDLSQPLAKCCGDPTPDPDPDDRS